MYHAGMSVKGKPGKGKDQSICRVYQQRACCAGLPVRAECWWVVSLVARHGSRITRSCSRFMTVFAGNSTFWVLQGEATNQHSWINRMICSTCMNGKGAAQVPQSNGTDWLLSFTYTLAMARSTQIKTSALAGGIPEARSFSSSEVVAPLPHCRASFLVQCRC